MPAEKKHTALPGFIAERALHELHGGGEAVLQDLGEEAGEDRRWRVTHFPSGRTAYALSEKKGRKLLQALQQGVDAWGVIPEPPPAASDPGANGEAGKDGEGETPETAKETAAEIVVLPTESRSLSRSNPWMDTAPAPESWHALVRRHGIFKGENLIEDLKWIAQNASVTYQGEEYPDYRLRFQALKYLTDQTFGTPGKAGEISAQTSANPAASIAFPVEHPDWKRAMEATGITILPPSQSEPALEPPAVKIESGQVVLTQKGRAVTLTPRGADCWTGEIQTMPRDGFVSTVGGTGKVPSVLLFEPEREDEAERGDAPSLPPTRIFFPSLAGWNIWGASWAGQTVRFSLVKE